MSCRGQAIVPRASEHRMCISRPPSLRLCSRQETRGSTVQQEQQQLLHYMAVNHAQVWCASAMGASCTAVPSSCARCPVLKGSSKHQSRVTMAAEDIKCPITQLAKPLLTPLQCGTLNGYEWKALSTPSILERSRIALKHNSEENPLIHLTPGFQKIIWKKSYSSESDSTFYKNVFVSKQVTQRIISL